MNNNLESVLKKCIGKQVCVSYMRANESHNVWGKLTEVNDDYLTIERKHSLIYINRRTTALIGIAIKKEVD